MSFAKHRKNSDLNSLKDKFDRINGKQNFADLGPTYWTPKHVGGAEHMGEAIVRFLPAPPDGNGGQEPDEFVKYFQYSLHKNGKHYINRGRNSLGADQPDPAADYNKTIWARSDLTKEEKKKHLVDRAEYFIANIYVIKDPNKPENEGKVFRWQFGKQVYNMINEQLFPKFETDPAVNVFDPEEGADFVFRVTPKVVPDRITGENKKIPTYEHSKFMSPSKRWDVESGEFDAIWAQCHSLQSEVAEDKFKSYDDLKEQFDRVMATTTTPNQYKSTPKSANTKTVAPKEERTVAEDIDDDLPWEKFEDDTNSGSSLTEDEEVFTPTKTEVQPDDDMDDWFSSLGK